MNRADFLRRLAFGAAGLVVGEDALEAFARLTHKRRLFSGVTFAEQARLDVFTSPELFGELDITFRLGCADAAMMQSAFDSGALLTVDWDGVQAMDMRVVSSETSVLGNRGPTQRFKLNNRREYRVPREVFSVISKYSPDVFA